MAQESWSVGRLVDWTENYFSAGDIPDARIDAEMLLSFVLNCRRLDLYLRKDETVGDGELKRFKALIIERRKRKPVSYITGEREFMGLRLKVDNATLIPRPETELLVEQAAKIVCAQGFETIIELGTGSGNIAVALAKFTKAGRIFSGDKSLAALRTAQSNIDTHGVSGRVTLRRGDLFEAFKNENLEGGVDMIVSNPPYIAADEKDQLSPEVLFEPHSALFGDGEDGLEFYRKIVKDAPRFLRAGGYIALELNSNRSAQIQTIVADNGFDIIELVKDYAGLERILIAIVRK